MRQYGQKDRLFLRPLKIIITARQDNIKSWTVSHVLHIEGPSSGVMSVCEEDQYWLNTRLVRPLEGVEGDSRRERSNGERKDRYRCLHVYPIRDLTFSVTASLSGPRQPIIAAGRFD